MKKILETERLILKEPIEADPILRHYSAKNDALRRTDRYFKIYNKNL